MKEVISVALMLCLMGNQVVFAKTEKLEVSDRIDISLLKEAEHSIELGLKWLEKNQEKDGSWSNYPGVTGLAAIAFLWNPKRPTSYR